MTRRAASLILSLITLLVLSVTPAVAQDEATPQPLPTPPPYADGALVQLVMFFSPTCGHCHTVITETLPPLFEEHGGTPVTTYDQSIAPEDVAYYFMSNGQLQILFVDTTVPAGQGIFKADSLRLDIDPAGVPRLDVEGSYLVGSTDIPDQLPAILAEALAGEGIGWPEVPGLATALAPFVEMGAIPELEPAAALVEELHAEEPPAEEPPAEEAPAAEASPAA